MGSSSLIRRLLWEIPPLVSFRRCAQEDRWCHHASALAKTIAAAECLESSQKIKTNSTSDRSLCDRDTHYSHIQPMGYSRYRDCGFLWCVVACSSTRVGVPEGLSTERFDRHCHRHKAAQHIELATSTPAETVRDPMWRRRCGLGMAVGTRWK